MPDNVQSILKHCKKLVSDPAYRAKYLQSAAKSSRGIIGYFSNYVPAEIIVASGFHPLRIIGSFTSADGHALLHPACSFVQDVMAAARNNDFKYLDGLIFPNSCDSLKLLQQTMQNDFPNLCCKTLLHSVNTDKSAISYFAQQLRQMAHDLYSAFSEEELKTVCHDYNSIRGMLRNVYELRQSNQLNLSYADTLAVMTAGLIMDRYEFAVILRQISEHTRCQQVSVKLKKIMLCGPLMDNLALAAQIETSGCRIIGDDLTNGWRSCCHDIELGGDIYENIAKKILLSSPSPTLNYADDSEFIRRVRELNPDGAIFINQKFCEPHVHSYLERRSKLEQLNVKTLMIDIDHSASEIQKTDLLRIESFIELL